MEDLLEDIQVFMDLEQGKNVDFWRDMKTITEDEITELRKLEASGKGPGERREAVNTSVSSDVQSVFKGKTYKELQVIFQAIEGRVRASRPNLDTDYCESLLQQLHAHMARARLRERHQDGLRQRLFQLKQELQDVETEPLSPSRSQSTRPPTAPNLQSGPPSPGTSVDTAPGEADGEAVLMEEDLIRQSLADYEAGHYSLGLLTEDELPVDAHVLEPHEDLQLLQLSRQQQRGRASLWADKYRPCKPRFFNRVHTGFEWNKYKQTHYDLDNPLPKIVQGYKFNIFYPDLIRKRATPEYFLEACPDNLDFAILCFHAGPS